MKPKYHNFQIPLNRDFKRRTSLNEIVIKSILPKNAGWVMYADYKVEFRPNDHFAFNVSLIDFEERIHFNEYTLQIFSFGIKKGIKEFIKDQNEKGIGVGGMDIKIENFSYHAVDSKPLAFQSTIKSVLNTLEKSNYFRKDVLQIEHSSSFFTINKIETNDKINLINSNVIRSNQIKMDRIFEESIVLKTEFEILILDFNKIPIYSIILKPNEDYNSPINLNFEEDENLGFKYPFIMDRILNQLDEVIDILSIKELHLRAVNINIKPLIKKEEYHGNNFDHDHNFIKWALLNLLLDENNDAIERTCLPKIKRSKAIWTKRK